ncbi:uncharacterized protein LOC113291534 [Papaver somniferum]|uniref:uncharacterized protein LOC113291534 n=1 Tax=Papaver somniferum TaxID=3469 RepID=UPI000E6F9098|nr:uncharacterized protein LOC113291534 [Papaver somniferum]
MDKSTFDMDNNTRYFHSIVNKRLHVNTINALCDTSGNWYRDRDGINNLLTNHFRTVASTSNPIMPDDAFDVIPKLITDSDNIMLHSIPTEIEIENKVKHVPSWSSPGPDGFQAGFYQTQWQLVGKDIVDVVQRFFTSGQMPRCLNRTYICLIPKYKTPKQPFEFRPIGLCNASYKIISKILANKLKPFLKKLSSPYQAAFVPGRAIHDNIIIAHELIHSMKHKEGFSGAETNKIITGVKVSRRAPPISHLLFADDILIFGQANTQHINAILQILQNFGNLSGQMLNFDKSCVYFSKNLSPHECDNFSQALNMAVINDNEKYLGAPLLLGHSKIPTTLLEKLDSLQMNFWWGHKAKKGIKFIAWDNINKAKELGGLGFRDLETFNITLICKLKLNENCSWIWWGIYRSIDFIKQHSFWDIICGTRTKIWLDCWVIGLDHPPIPYEGLVNTLSYSNILDLFHLGTRTWNTHLVYYLIDAESATKIISMDVPAIGEDTLIWLPDRNGQFSVKSAYNVLFKLPNPTAVVQNVSSQVWKVLWKVKIPHKVKLFV